MSDAGDGNVKRFTRRSAAWLLAAGPAILLVNFAWVMTQGQFHPNGVGIAPAITALGIAGAIDPRILDAMLNRPGTPRWAYVAAVLACLSGLAVGIWIVFELKGGNPG